MTFGDYETQKPFYNMNATTTCIFSDPMTYDNDVPNTHLESWNYSKSVCTGGNISNATTTFSQGDIIISLFLLVILFLSLASFLVSLIYGVKLRWTKPY